VISGLNAFEFRKAQVVERAMDRAQKEAQVATLNAVFKDAGVIVVTHYKGLTVKQMTELRVAMGEAGAKFKVAKNSLVKLALADTDAAGIADLFEGPTAVAYSDDPVAAPKITAGFAKKNEDLVILGGAMGRDVLDAAAVKALAELPSLDELRGQIVGMISTPATRIVRLLKEPGSAVARVINAYSETSEAA
jgi:large subunit ribosomal protein L10